MKSTIGKKIMFMIFIPFLAIFGMLSSYTYATVIQYATNWMELEIKGIADINAADLEGRMDSVRISALSMASVLEGLDAQSDNAREQADEAIKTMFMNESIYNVWLAYEPQAFDGEDEKYTQDYVGAPSGRFIRSYIVEDGQIIVAPDMDEETLDNPEESPWYTVPRDTNQLYIDVDNGNANLYDYGVGEESVYTLSIVAPICRNGEVIGCVGADVLFDNMTFGINNDRQAMVAVFYPNGRIFYSPGIEYAEETIDTLQFKNTEQIKEAMAKGEAVFLPDEYSAFADANAFTYICPIYDINGQGGSLYLYVAAPRRPAFANWTKVFVIIAGITITVFVVLLVMLLYVIRKISRPIRELILAADAISRGEIETEITYFAESKDEIGLLSRSLHRLVEQFRIYIMELEQTQEEMSLHAQIEDLISGDGSIQEIFDDLTVRICLNFKINKATVVYADVGKATVLSYYEKGHEEQDRERKPDFLYHAHVESLLFGKKFVFMNTHAIAAQGAMFADRKTASVSLLPLGNDYLWGYIILESRSARRTLNASTESALLYIAKILSDWLSERSMESDGMDGQAGKPENNPEIKYAKKEEEHSKGTGILEPESVAEDSKFIISLRKIDGLDVDTALESMGGLTDVYEKSVRLTARLIPETMEKMDGYIAGENAKFFAIEIHGMKGVFNNIGAFTLGNGAAGLEKDALAEDLDYCRENYKSFRKVVMDFLKQLKPITVKEDMANLKPGDKKMLFHALKEAEVAVEGFDSMEAIEQLAPLKVFSFDGEADALLKEIILTLEVFDCENALTMIRKLEERLD